MLLKNCRIVVLAACLASLQPSFVAAQSKLDSLITIQKGDLPIILSAPHGGSDAIPDAPKRRGVGVTSFNSITDAGTDKLTEKLADEIEKQLGKRPYLVIAKFHRQYLDANRRPSDAYESPDSNEIYDRYHQALSNASEEVSKRWGFGILIDIHGQSAEPNSIFRGTRNGRTTKHLTRRFRREALIGESSLFGQLAKQGLTVVPAVNSNDSEHGRYNGGFIVGKYGSNSGGTVDAIQLEIGKKLRLPSRADESAIKIASAITSFADDYLPREQQLPHNLTSYSPTVCVGVYVDKGTGGSLKSLLTDIGTFDGMSVTKLTADDIRTGKLSEVDLLIQPGGSGGGQGRHLGESGREAIREFVHDGGGFIGICGGAYLASAHYKWSLNILDAKVLDTKHWARGHGDVKIGITEAGMAWLNTQDPQLTIKYWQGPLLAPANRPEIEDYEAVAVFDTEIAKNGAPKGVMLGTTAIAKGQFGKGRVVCFSPHPELTESLEHLIEHAINHVKRKRLSKREDSKLD